MPEPLVCNGHEALCDRPFDAVAYPTTHNAMSNAEERWIAPNQTFGMGRQLVAGNDFYLEFDTNAGKLLSFGG